MPRKTRKTRKAPRSVRLRVANPPAGAKTSALGLLFVLCSACSRDGLCSLTVRADGRIEVVDAVNGAAEFWRERKIDVAVVDEGLVVVSEVTQEQLDEKGAGYIAYFEGPELGSGVVHVKAAEWTPDQRRCVVAHEFGHAIGMQHTGSDGLMAERTGYVGDDNECLWSEDDQVELVAVCPSCGVEPG